MAKDFKYKNLIAACGMNCGICIGHLRERKPCNGCLTVNDPNKPKGCRNCAIVKCQHLIKSQSGFCYECSLYPCKRLSNLDKRYRKNYGMSMIENLNYIATNGINNFLKKEENKWLCGNCGEGISVHRNNCLHCNSEINR